jgi:hypothetical protein
MPAVAMTKGIFGMLKTFLTSLIKSGRLYLYSLENAVLSRSLYPWCQAKPTISESLPDHSENWLSRLWSTSRVCSMIALQKGPTTPPRWATALGERNFPQGRDLPMRT